MAILRGFPPSNTISASVRIMEKDLSYLQADQSFHRAGLIGFASKGPINQPTVVASNRQLHTTFGYAHPDVSDPFLIYAAEQYLLVASELFIVRVADESPVSSDQATLANIVVPAAGEVVKVESDTAGPYTFAADSFFRWRLNGVLSENTLVVSADAYNVDELVVVLNDQLTDQDGIVFYESDNNTISVKTTFAYGPSSELELVSVMNSIYGGTIMGGNPTGLGTGMEAAEVTGTLSMYPDAGYQTPGVYDFTGLTGLNLNIVVDGADNVLIDNVVQTINLADLEGTSWTISQVVTEINSQKTENGGTLPGGWIATASGNNLKFATSHFGRDAKLRIKADSTAEALFGLSTTTKIGVSPIGDSGDISVETFGRISGTENLDDSETFTITADSAGIEGNNTQVKITNDPRSGTWNMDVYNNGVQVESWGGLTKDETSNFYVETYIGLVSDYIRVENLTSEPAAPLNGIYSLSGGTDGIPTDPDDQDGLLIGESIGNTGMFALSEPEQIDIDLIAVPGHSSTSVVVSLLDICQNYRMDCLAIIDPPFGLSVNEIVAWQNGTHFLNITRFDSDFGALYWPWVKIRDSYNKLDVWVPPSGSVMATIARSDYLTQPWFAPAGQSRGVVPGILDVYSKPTLEEKDLMYGNRNAVNPIVSYSDFDGFVIWGQKTLQRRPTLLDRVSTRRLMFVIEKRIRRASRGLIFDPHDETFRQKFITIATNILREIQIGRGINAFIIKADEELNTDDVVNRNEFRARIGIQPIPAAEFMFLEFSVHRVGNFAENGDTF